MKLTLTTFFILALFLTVSAQKKATDREFEGLKDSVKTVSIEYMPFSGSDGVTAKNKRVIWGVRTYDKAGRLVKEFYPSDNSTLIFSIIDGFKSFKIIRNRKEPESKNVLMTAPISEEKPIEEPEKIVPPDKRFDRKYVYEYDSEGRVKSEREYLNNGKLTDLRTFEYYDNGLLKEENLNDTVALSKFNYKYDKDGNLIEKLADRDIKGAGTDSKTRNVYSDYKVDARGNWTERKSTWYYDVNGEPEVYVKKEYQVITYY